MRSTDTRPTGYKFLGCSDQLLSLCISWTSFVTSASYPAPGPGFWPLNSFIFYCSAQLSLFLRNFYFLKLGSTFLPIFLALVIFQITFFFFLANLYCCYMLDPAYSELIQYNVIISFKYINLRLRFKLLDEMRGFLSYLYIYEICSIWIYIYIYFFSVEK